MVRYKHLAQKGMIIFLHMFLCATEGKYACTPPTGWYCSFPFKFLPATTKRISLSRFPVNSREIDFPASREKRPGSPGMIF
jgi:hypothetical protein